MTGTFTSELSFGATYLGRNRTRFRLWAPRHNKISLEIDGHLPVALDVQADGWCETEVSCAPGAAYVYRLESGQVVPDPASRAQADDIHGDRKSVV